MGGQVVYSEFLVPKIIKNVTSGELQKNFGVQILEIAGKLWN